MEVPLCVFKCLMLPSFYGLKCVRSFRSTMLIGSFTLRMYCRHFVCLLPSRILVFKPLISVLVFMRFKMLNVHSPVLTVCGLFDSTHFTMATDSLSRIYMVSKECFMH
jgi:hypothetical protein